jgi:hypothetical protein
MPKDENLPLTLDRLKSMTLSEKQARLIRVICDDQITDQEIDRLLAIAEGIELDETGKS